VNKEDVLSALDRILAAEEFRKSERATAFLRYVVTQDLEGNQQNLQGTTIAQDVFGRDESFDANSDPIVRVQAGRVRKLLETYYAVTGKEDPVRITIPKGGYAPQYEVRAVEPTARLNESPPAKPDSAAPTWRRAVTHPPTVIIGLLLAALLVASLPRIVGDTTTRDAFVAPNGPKVYVAQFGYVGEPNLEKLLKTGFQIELIDRLSRFRELFVYGPDAPYQADPSGVIQDGEEQRIIPDFVLSGTIEHVSDRISITGQLVETGTSSVIWSQKFTTVMANPLEIAELKSSIAGEVAASLGQPYGVIQTHLGQKLAGAPELTFNDYVCVLRFYEYARAKTATGHRRMRDCLERAVKISPDFSFGWAALSWIYGDEVRYGFNPRVGDASADERSLRAAEQAVATDPFNAMAHQYLGEAHILRGDVQAYLRATRRALELNPNDSETLAGFAWNMALISNSSEARQMAEKAIELNPGHPPWYHGGLAIHFYRAGDFDQAHFHAERFKADGSALSHILLIGACSRTGHEAQSAESWTKLRQSYPDVADDPAQTLRTRQFPEELIEKLVNDIEKAARFSLEAM